MGGLGGAFLNAPAFGAIAHWFNKRRGLATGIATTAGGIGGVIFPIIMSRLLDEEKGVGFPWACRILGFILLGLCIPANFFIRSRLPPRIDENGKPIIASTWPDVTIFRNKGYAWTTVGVFFMEWGLFVPLTYIVSYSKAQGNSDSFSSALLSILNAGSVFGRLIPGFLADKFGRFNVLVITAVLCAIVPFAFWVPAHLSNAVLVVFAASFGFASGSNLGLYPVCVGQFCPSQQYGVYYSLTTVVASFGSLSILPIGGALVGLGGEKGWNALIFLCGGAYTACLICYVVGRTYAVGWKIRQKF